jgi:hypothetical protein
MAMLYMYHDKCGMWMFIPSGSKPLMSPLTCFFMDTNCPVNSNRSSKILIWNVRGINSQDKWDAIRGNITESDYQVLCLQETKRAHFDSYYIKNFCPKSLDHFAFSPSIGASGDLLTI